LKFEKDEDDEGNTPTRKSKYVALIHEEDTTTKSTVGFMSHILNNINADLVILEGTKDESYSTFSNPSNFVVFWDFHFLNCSIIEETLHVVDSLNPKIDSDRLLTALHNINMCKSVKDTLVINKQQTQEDLWSCGYRSILFSFLISRFGIKSLDYIDDELKSIIKTYSMKIAELFQTFPSGTVWGKSNLFQVFEPII
jgi:hypothetical protein